MPLKSPEQGLATVLVSDPAVASLVGQRVYPVIAPAAAALPFVTWRRSGVQRQQTLSGPMGMPTVTLTIEAYAETYEAVRDLADRIRLALDGYGGTPADSAVVKNVSLDNESDGFIQLTGGDLPFVYSVTMTFSVMWSEQ
jgi:hypothetical protein